jgi:hypothetical protein
MAHNIKPGLQLAMKYKQFFSYAKKRICTGCKRNRIKHYKRVLETAAKLNASYSVFKWWSTI